MSKGGKERSEGGDWNAYMTSEAEPVEPQNLNIISQGRLVMLDGRTDRNRHSASCPWSSSRHRQACQRPIRRSRPCWGWERRWPSRGERAEAKERASLCVCLSRCVCMGGVEMEVFWLSSICSTRRYDGHLGSTRSMSSPKGESSTQSAGIDRNQILHPKLIPKMSPDVNLGLQKCGRGRFISRSRLDVTPKIDL